MRLFPNVDYITTQVNKTVNSASCWFLL